MLIARRLMVILFVGLLAVAHAVADPPGLEVTADHADTGNLFTPNQAIAFTIRSSTATSQAPLTIDAALLDSRGEETGHRIVLLKDADDAQADFGTHAEGYYELHLRVAATGWVKVVSLGVLPRSGAVPAAASERFGTIAHLKRVDESDREKMIRMISRVGFGWVREGFRWQEIEPTPGQWNWSKYDDIVRLASEVGLRVLPVLCFSTEWASTAPDDLPRAKRLSWKPKLPDWRGYVRAVAKRYGSKVHAWEVWNEPNIRTFWQPKSDPRGYADVLAAAYSVLKADDPGCIVVSAGLGPQQMTFPDRPEDFESKFLTTILRRHPAPLDAIGYHPYTAFRYGVTHARTEQRFDHMMANLFANDDDRSNHLPLWFTEMGVSTIPRITTERMAAGYLTVSMTLALEIPRASKFFCYNFRDVGTDPTNKEDMFGLVRHDYTPKPGLFAVTTLMKQIGSATFVGKRSANEVSINAFRSGDEHIWVVWSDREASKVDLPAGADDVKVFNNLGQRLSAASDRPVHLSAGHPKYIRFKVSKVR